jgi:putative thiamine transport system substrate-binding protein
MMITRRHALGIGAFGLATVAGLRTVSAASWDETVAAAKGQTLYFNAWGGDPKINAYIAWAGEELQKQFGVTMNHVKLADTVDAVGRIISEAEGGKTESGGSVDLIWINGKNFETLKTKGLLHGPFTQDTPNFKLVDTEGNATALTDFTIPVDGHEAPWGTARFVFVHDSAKDAVPPTSLAGLMDFAKANPGRFTYPQPPDFLGTTFLKQLLLALSFDGLDVSKRQDALRKPADDAAFAAFGAPVFAYLDQLHPSLWREGKAFPDTGTTLRTMMSNGELRLITTFNPAMAANAVLAGELPETVRTYALDGGSIGNTHFVAIPKNSSVKPAAMLAANFLMSAEAQARKADLAIWGDPTVLAHGKLNDAQKALFTASSHPALPDPAKLGPMMLEPDPSWGSRLETEWKSRYAAG